MGLKVTATTKSAIEERAKVTGRTQSQEAEWLIELALATEFARFQSEPDVFIAAQRAVASTTRARSEFADELTMRLSNCLLSNKIPLDPREISKYSREELLKLPGMGPKQARFLEDMLYEHGQLTFRKAG